MTVKIYKRQSTSSGEYYLCDSYKDVRNYSLMDNSIILMLGLEDSAVNDAIICQRIIEKTILHFSTQVDYKIEITEPK